MKPIKAPSPSIRIKSGKFSFSAIPSTYYTLWIDWNKDGNFSPEFGDWFKYIVKQEQKDSYEGETFKIIETMEEGYNNG
jgi:hypothetical protein